jgi:hypothetical protein
MKRMWIIAVAALVAVLSAANAAELSARDDVVPLIEMREVPLTDALQQVAGMGHLNIILDPKLSQAPYNTMAVSIRWEKVTAREALIALLDNYDLVLIDSPRSRRCYCTMTTR